MEGPAGIGAIRLCGAKLLLVGIALAISAGAGTHSPESAPHRLGAHQRLAQEEELQPCLVADLDCRAFTGTLSWQPDDRRPLLSSRGLKRLSILKDLGLGERERALRCLAIVAWAEARSDGVPGMRAVIAVVLNRSRDPAFPAHPCDVIGVSAAFESMDSSAHRRTADASRAGALPSFPQPDNAIDAAALQVARLLAWNLARSTGHEDPTFGATHFLAPAVLRKRNQAPPRWATVFEHTARIGGHDFYKRPMRLARDG